MRIEILLLCTFAIVDGVCAQCEVEALFGSGAPESGFVDLEGEIAVLTEKEFANHQGAAFVYRWKSSAWHQEAMIMAPRPNPDECFGAAVAIGSDMVLIGADNAGEAPPGDGAVYAYRYVPERAIWSFEDELTASDGALGDRFGARVSIEGDIALIGSFGDGNSIPGSAYIFRQREQRWFEEAKLVDPRGEPGEGMGVAVSIRRDLAVVGASRDDDAGVNSGSVLVFRHDAGRWPLEAELYIPDPLGGERFGRTVATDGHTIAAVSTQVDSQNGAVYIFRQEAGRWTFQQKLSAADPSGPFPQMGASLSMSRDGLGLLAGAPDDFANGFESGAAHLFQFADGRWSEIVKILPDDGVAGAHFGSTLALDDDLALIRASCHPPAGKIYVYAGMSPADCNANGTPDACDLPGDADGDGVVNVEDLIAVILAWGPCPPCAADLDCSGAVDFADIVAVIANWT